MSYSYAKEYLSEHKIWIIKSIQKLKNKRKNPTLFENGSILKLYNTEILFKKSDIHSIKISKENYNYQILFPLNYNFNSNENQKEIRIHIKKILKEVSLKHISILLNSFSQKYFLEYTSIKFRDMKSRWGSCSFKNGISLNIHISRLPIELIEYILIHELAHTKIKNHSKEFWNFLETLLPNSKYLDKSLNSFSTNLF